jgi:hypothetical protein
VDTVRSEPGGVTWVECMENCFDDAVNFFIDLIVPEAKNSIACFLQLPISRYVSANVPFGGVLPAIDLGDQPRSPTLEINHIRRNR